MNNLINFNMLKQIHKPQAIWACILSLGLSFSIVAGWLYDKTSFLAFTPKHVAAFVLLFLILIVLLYALLVCATCGQGARGAQLARRINTACAERERKREREKERERERERERE